MKTCSKCGVSKEETEFYRRAALSDKRHSDCKNCQSEHKKKTYEKNRKTVTERVRKYQRDNREAVARRGKRYREENPELLAARNKKYYEENRESVLKCGKKYYEENRKAVAEGQREYMKKRRAADPVFRMVRNLRYRTYHALKRQSASKTSGAFDLVGMSGAEHMEYLAARFTEGMTRENYGLWHVDHIRPLSSFDLTDPEQQKQAFHFSNTQPLWGPDNLKKSDKWDPPRSSE